MIDYAPNPEAYASKLARYIADPSTIRARTMEFWGRAPSLERCRVLREKHSKPIRKREAVKLYQGSFQCGHSRSETNTYWNEDGVQTCKTCHREEQRLIRKLEREQEKLRQELEALALRKAKQEDAKQLAALTENVAERIGLFTDDLIAEVARHMKVSYLDVMSESRKTDFVLARAVITQILLDRGLSFVSIAKRLKRKCHSSVRNLHLNWEKYCEEFPHVKSVYEALR